MCAAKLCCFELHPRAAERVGCDGFTECRSGLGEGCDFGGVVEGFDQFPVVGFQPFSSFGFGFLPGCRRGFLGFLVLLLCGIGFSGRETLLVCPMSW